jgi:hypothetical protein
MGLFYEVGDLIKVQGTILSLRFGSNPPQGSIAFNTGGENIAGEGQVVSVSENGQVRRFKISSSETSGVVGKIFDVNSFDNLQIEKNG